MPHFPEEFFKYVKSNLHSDLNKLRLAAHGKSMPPWFQQALLQIESQRKAGTKFEGMQPRLMLHPLSVEQATSAPLAYKHAEIALSCLKEKPKKIADLTCGMGIDLRALRQASGAYVVGIELNTSLAEITAENFSGDNGVTILNADSTKWIANYTDDPFDIIFIDPARRDVNGERVFAIEECSPNVVSMLPTLAAKTSLLMVKLSPMLDVTATLRSFAPYHCRLYMLGNRRECLEMFAVVDFRKGTSLSNIEHTITIIDNIDNGTEPFSFNLEENKAMELSLGNPHEGQLLYEPSACTMKAAPFASICKRFGLAKLHANTHLFVGEDTPVARQNGLQFPGMVYHINKIYTFAASTVKKIGREIGHADVAVRNFPIKAEELQNRLKVKPSPERRLIGITSSDGSHLLLLLDKI